MPDSARPDQPLTKELQTARAFVRLVETLVDDFDVIDLLTELTSTTVDLLEAGAAGILLADQSGNLRVMASSSDTVQLLELFQLQNEQGPCLDCFRTGLAVIDPHLGPSSPWPEFAEQAVLAGLPSVCALPLRLRDIVLGCLNLFMVEHVEVTTEQIDVAQALADVASIAIVQARVAHDSAVREQQLQEALDSRIAIEQAKGMLAERGQLPMDEAFRRLRLYARSSGRGLTSVALGLVGGIVSPDDVIAKGG